MQIMSLFHIMLLQKACNASFSTKIILFDNLVNMKSSDLFIVKARFFLFTISKNCEIIPWNFVNNQQSFT